MISEAEIISTVRRRLTNHPNVLWFDRLNSGKVETRYGSWIQLCRKGTPDFYVITRNGKIIFIECKRLKGGVKGLFQKAFAELVSQTPNVYHTYATSYDAVERVIQEAVNAT